MDVESNNLPKLDEAKALYKTGEDTLYEKTKKDLLNKLNNENKDMLIC